MSEKNKQLLTKDICERMPYGVKCTTKANGWPGVYPVCGFIGNKVILDCPKEVEGDDIWLVQNIVPYLRPMSSMTEEEQKEFVQFHCVTLCPVVIDEMLTLGNERDMFDWLNARHFDHRGLIEMGLALEAPEGIYETKTE